MRSTVDFWLGWVVWVVVSLVCCRVRVQKMSLSHPEQGPLGYIYLDPQPREHKYAHAAHFTVRCGCHAIGIDDNDDINNYINNGSYSSSSSSSSSSPSPSSSSSPPVVHDGYQLPVVALVMSFGAPGAASFASPDYDPQECLLGHGEVSTKEDKQTNKQTNKQYQTASERGSEVASSCCENEGIPPLSCSFFYVL